MRTRPQQVTCCVCGYRLLPIEGLTTTVQPYLTHFWPPWAPPIKDYIGPAHVSCLRSAGVSAAWTECRRRWSVEVAGIAPIYSMDSAFLGTSANGVEIELDGMSLGLSPRQLIDFSSSSTFTERARLIFDLYGLPSNQLAAVRSLVRSDGHVPAHDLIDTLDLRWFDLPSPVIGISFARTQETETKFKEQTLIGDAFTTYTLPPDIADAVLGVDVSLWIE